MHVQVKRRLQQRQRRPGSATPPHLHPSHPLTLPCTPFRRYQNDRWLDVRIRTTCSRTLNLSNASFKSKTSLYWNGVFSPFVRNPKICFIEDFLHCINKINNTVKKTSTYEYVTGQHLNSNNCRWYKPSCASLIWCNAFYSKICYFLSNILLNYMW